MIKSNVSNVRWQLVVGACLFLTGCATGSGGQHAKASPLPFLNSYSMALQDYNAGKVMEARARILAMDVGRDDYKQAQTLLKNKVNPARIRLLRHYKAKGKKAEKNHKWSKAMVFYQQAAEFSAEPDIFLAYVSNMALKMRQERMDALLKQRRLEDNTWINWSRSYEPPRGVQASDVAFSRMRSSIESDIEDRTVRSYREARRYLKKDMAGVAYVEIESYLRLMPASEKGQRLMEDVRKAMPKGLLVRALNKNAPTKKVRRGVSAKEHSARKSDVLKLMKKGKWLQAKDAALLYRRYEGKGAEKLLKSVNIGLEKAAASLFARGSAAFRREHIDEAVKLWSQAAEMQPANSEYVDALRRATQLQERLHLLRSDLE
ncbi:MAG: hypothetical protein Q9M21_08115 [Mariprofundaceae bacterium]|nr:hypothetical protein [Mariprofundaceae bacterium]